LDGAEQELLLNVMAAAEAGEEFEIENGASETTDAAPEAPKADKAPKQTDEEKAAAKAAKDAEKAAAKEAKEKEAAEKKAAKDAERARIKAEKEAAAKADKEPKVTRPGICGEVLRDKGLSLTKDVKIDEALATIVDELYGKTNLNESLFALRNAKNSILGYLASTEAALPAPTAPTAE
jgi:chromatin segregation and condensation protein Rec8/ScpA/Scc1 (kleisin family)